MAIATKAKDTRHKGTYKEKNPCRCFSYMINVR